MEEGDLILHISEEGINPIVIVLIIANIFFFEFHVDFVD